MATPQPDPSSFAFDLLFKRAMTLEEGLAVDSAGIHHHEEACCSQMVNSPATAMGQSHHHFFGGVAAHRQTNYMSHNFQPPSQMHSHRAGGAAGRPSAASRKNEASAFSKALRFYKA